MKTSLKTGFAQIFSCCPQKMGAQKFGAGLQPPLPPIAPPPPHRPPGPYIPRKEIKKDKLFFKQLRTSYLLG